MEIIFSKIVESILILYFVCSLVPPIDKIIDRCRSFISSSQLTENIVSSNQVAAFNTNEQERTIMVRGYSKRETNELIEIIDHAT